MNDSKKKITHRMVFACIGICFFAAALAVGTFKDEAIARTLFSKDDIICTAFGIIGPMPLFFILAPFTGALIQRSLASESKARIPLALISLILLLTVGFLGARTFASSDCLDSVIPSVRGKMALIIPIMIFVFLPFGYLGYRLAKKNEDVLLANRIIMLLLAVLIAYLTLELVKGTMRRPRYRTAVKGFEGVGFVPWYEKFPFTKELPGLLGIEKTEFASFPSGHSMMSMSSFITFPALTWLIPSLRGREQRLAACGVLYSLAIMISRLTVGAHYLSDVSASGVIMLTFSLIYMALLRRTYKE